MPYALVTFCKKIITAHRLLCIVLVAYIALHLTHLTLLPIFNDESIYLDWGWVHTHTPGRLYDALLDAKQPLLIWIFGIAESVFTDPLFAGRLVSVIIGALSLLGIYMLGKKICNTQVAIFASILYASIPLFVFYNRQALMESAVACVGIWLCLALLQLIAIPSRKHGIIYGIVAGVGFFIKSSTMLFIFSAIVIMLFSIVVKKRVALIKPLSYALLAFLCVDLLLLINPVFWQTLPSNNRYAYTFGEIVSFPFAAWTGNFLAFFYIGFVYITPFVFIASLFGTVLLIKNKKKYVWLIYFFIALMLEIVLSKGQQLRYIVPFFPFLVIPAAYVCFLLWNSLLWKKVVVVVCLFVPFIFSLILVINPVYYIFQAGKIIPYADTAYLVGRTSGFGINETMHYIQKHASTDKKNLVFFAFNVGNPENAIDLYAQRNAQRNAQLYSFHIDAQLFPQLADYTCLSSPYPVFFVTRDDELAGLNAYFVLENVVKNPYSNYTLRVYTLKKNCTGKTLDLFGIN
jgi:hypothetical protein